jgi:hypothetical protein
MYTLGVGLLPAAIRLIAYDISGGSTDPFFSGDLITLGLVIHVSMINEIEDISSQRFQFKTVYNGLSILFITVYGFLLAHQAGLMPAAEEERVLRIALMLAGVSCLMGLAFFAIMQFGGRSND